MQVLLEVDVITISTAHGRHHQFGLDHRPAHQLIVVTPRRLQMSGTPLSIAQHQYPYVAGVAPQVAQPRLQRHRFLLVVPAEDVTAHLLQRHDDNALIQNISHPPKVSSGAKGTARAFIVIDKANVQEREVRAFEPKSIVLFVPGLRHVIHVT